MSTVIEKHALLQETLKTATELVNLKRMQFRQKLRRLVSARTFERQFAETEKQMISALIPVIRSMVEEAANSIEHPGNPRNAVRRHFDADKAKRRLVDAVFPILAKGMSEAAVAQMMMLGIDVRKKPGKKASTATQWLQSQGIATPPGVSTDLPQWMKDAIATRLEETFAQDYWDGINQTTLDDIEGVLRTGMQEGESITEMAKKIKEELNNEYYHGRAKNIARTESANALNGARKASMDALREMIPEVPMRAEWLSVLGTTTRDTHALLDGVPEGKDGKWSLGGKRVPWPGHYSLPPGERCHCQCSLVVSFGMDEDAALREIQEYSDRLDEYEEKYAAGLVGKAFCPTGPGGGVDPTCSPGGSGSSQKPSPLDAIRLAAQKASEDPTRVIPIADVTNIKDLGGGINTSMMMHFKDGSKGVFKPEYGEYEDIHPSFRKDATQAQREAAASYLNDVMKLDVTNKSEYVEFDFEKGSLSHWVDGEVAVDRLGFDPTTNYYAGVKGIDEMLYFDALIGNVDRHPGNWIIKDGRAVAIDNGYSFANNDDYATKKLPFKAAMTLAHTAIQVNEMPPKFRKGLEHLKENKADVAKKLRAFGFSSEQIEGLFRRAEFLIGDPSLDFSAQNLHVQIAQRSKPIVLEDYVKAFCPTGPGGGVDPTCSPGGGGSSKTQMVSASYNKDSKKWTVGGKDLPDHLPKRIPPAWKDVKVSLDPKADLLVKGFDTKGRSQSVYSDAHWARQASKKFARVNELRKKHDQVKKEIESDMKSDDPKIREDASVLKLIQHTGLRPGGVGDTGAEKQAYGATTLEGRHIKETSEGVRLQFVGKKGVDLDIPVNDKAIASMLLDRKRKAGDSGRVFSVDAGDLRYYAASKDGGGFKPKDFRTAKGTSTAAELVQSMPVPKNEKEYKKAVKEVATKVAEQLGNTPTIALQSYIDPTIFSKWRSK